MSTETDALCSSFVLSQSFVSCSPRPDRPQEDGSARRAHLTDWLIAWSGGRSESTPTALDAAYHELRVAARRALRRERAGHTLQPTALVHEAFLRLRDIDVAWRDRGHFLCVAAGLMRRLLVDHARAARRVKRGGGAARCDLMEADGATPGDPVDLLALDAALERLAKRSPEQCRMVELSYFAGLSYEEIAEALGVSRAAVGRGLRLAKAWLRRRLASEVAP